MQNKRLFLILLIGLALFPILSNAQFIVDYKKDGDRYFDNGNYYAAAIYYQKALKIIPSKDYFQPYNVFKTGTAKQKKDAKAYQYLLYKLGQSFRLYKDYESAEEWYRKVLQFNNDLFPLTRLWYGVTLRANSKYDSAIVELKQFKSDYSGQQKYVNKAKLEIASCEFAIEQLKYPRLAEIEELPQPINLEKGSEYAPVGIGDTLFFTSSRKLENINSRKHTPYINKLYITITTDTGYSQVERMSVKSDKYGEEAAASLNDNRLYFTEWHNGNKGDGQYVIMMSTLGEKGTWSDPVKLGHVVNQVDYSTKEASVTADGKYIVFASDRPGGSGGYDLWYAKLGTNGQPVGEAVNLGNTVNSEKDEVNPFYDAKEGKLIFSSNGRVGMGGFDLYFSQGALSDNDWTEPQNYGYPVNSSKDDNYYYPMEEKENKFYTSSDRNSVCCMDLYTVQLNDMKVIGHVYDADTHEPIKRVQTYLTDSLSGDTLGHLITKEDGYFHFPLINRRPLKMHFSHKVYGEKNIEITHAELKPVDSVYERDVYMKLVINRPIRIENVYYDFDKASLREESLPSLDSLISLLTDHPEWRVEIGAHTDALGADEYNQWLSQQRAQSVVDYLTAHGVARDRLEAKGYGEKQPVAPNKNPDGSDNPEGRQLNRRTEFTIIGLIRASGKTMHKLNSVVGDKNSIEVDKSKAMHMSTSEKWKNTKQKEEDTKE